MAVLKKFADTVDYKVQLNPLKLGAKLENGSKDESGNWEWLPVAIVDNEDSKYAFTDHIYGKYSIENSLQDLYSDENGDILSQLDRLKLMSMKFEAKKEDEGCKMSQEELIHKKAILASFPLHDYSKLAALKSKWIKLVSWPGSQPVDDIRNYFGAKLALYFSWLGSYTCWLFYASFVGVFSWTLQTFDSRGLNSPITPVFAFFMSVWSTLFLESWKRQQARHSLEWGTYGFEKEEVDRQEFEGDMIISPVDGKKIKYFPSNKKRQKLIYSTLVIFLATCVVEAVIGACMFLKVYVLSDEGDSEAEISSLGNKTLILTLFGNSINYGTSFIQPLANAISIEVIGRAFAGVASHLTHNENHQTETAMEDAHICKSFIFQFFNSYSILLYTAFMAHETRYCGGDCMATLGHALMIIFGTKMVVGNVQEIAGLGYSNKKKRAAAAMLQTGEDEDGKAVMEASKETMSAIEEQYLLAEFDPSAFSDYLEMVLQYGYATLFSAVFTLAPLLSFVNNFIEIRVDAWKLTSLCRRPEPHAAEDIGTWQSVLEIMSIVAIITNMALVCFKQSVLPSSYSLGQKAGVFLILEHILILLKVLLMIAIDDLPEDVAIQVQRTEFIVERVLYNANDDEQEIEDYAKMAEKKKRPANSLDDLSSIDMKIYASDEDWIRFDKSEGKVTKYFNKKNVES
uniref:Anoctamin transmembrane domain-containing protein n=1 Tax=Octactis speculum TaxID=3111310 RepID=A0A7S2B2C2_9STRA|mmetsp:Transcript_18699/g.25355  ORF Transcript_18699/g.25355 Transcript_18699/m.25355 type:complete len:684 (+) Transcript_18699:2-2053(+)